MWRGAPTAGWTGSDWQQSSLEAISDPPLPGYADRLAYMNKIISQGVMGLAGPAPKGAFGHDDRLRPRDTVVGLETAGEAKAYPMSALHTARVVNDRVEGDAVVIVHQPSSDTTTAFLAQANGKTLRFRAADAEADKLGDLETNSEWTAYGVCVPGRLKGTELKRLILEPEFWFGRRSSTALAPHAEYGRWQGSNCTPRISGTWNLGFESL